MGQDSSRVFMLTDICACLMYNCAEYVIRMKTRRQQWRINTIAPPASIPAIAPYLFERFQNRASSITGPNAAPKPAHAKDTIPKTEEFESHAITTPIMEITMSVTRAIII